MNDFTRRWDKVVNWCFLGQQDISNKSISITKPWSGGGGSLYSDLQNLWTLLAWYSTPILETPFKNNDKGRNLGFSFPTAMVTRGVAIIVNPRDPISPYSFQCDLTTSPRREYTVYCDDEDPTVSQPFIPGKHLTFHGGLEVTLGAQPHHPCGSVSC